MKIIEKVNNEVGILLKNDKGSWVEILSFRHTSGLNLPFEYNFDGYTLLSVITEYNGKHYTDCFYFDTKENNLIYREINNILDYELNSEYEFLVADNQIINVFFSDLIQDYFLTRPQFRGFQTNFDLSLLQPMYWV